MQMPMVISFNNHLKISGIVQDIRNSEELLTMTANKFQGFVLIVGHMIILKGQ